MSTVTVNQPSFDNVLGEFNTESFQNANYDNMDDINMQNNPIMLSEPKPTISQTETKQDMDNSIQDRLIESEGVVLPRKKVQIALANETELPLPPGKMEDNKLAYDLKPGLPLQKYVYSAKFLSKLIPSHSPNSRLRLGNSTIEFKKHYDLNRNKYDEIVQMTKAANTIIAIFTAAKSCLEATSNGLLDPVATWCENSVNGLEAWTGMIAEALKLISIESAIIEGTPYVNKKRLLSDAKQVLSSKFKDASESILAMEKIVDRLTRVLEGCSRTIYCLNTGCRSRFYQSVWQTDIFLEQNGQNDANLEGNEAPSTLRCSSNSMSTSSILSLNLLTAYVRWDVDGISIKKQVSKSWPLIKFSSLSFSSKVTSFAEIFSGFLVFLDIPTQNIWNALQSLQETSRPREEVTLLDHEFHTILAILLSERYFHPVEQHRALVCGIKLKKSFLLLQAELDKVKNCCKRLRDIWRKVFKNGELSLSAAAFAADATSVPLWKSCKDLNFQLDLCAEIPSKTRLDKILSSTASENVSRNPSYIQIEPVKSSLAKFNSSSAVISLYEIKKRFSVGENVLLQSLHEENAFISETEPTASETTNLSPAAMDRKFMSPTEAASILIAHGVTQLKLEIFPKRSKVLLLKKIRSVCSKIKECRSIIAHSISLSCSKMEKISDRLNTMLKTYSHTHLQETNTRSHPSATATVPSKKPISSTSDFKPGVSVSETSSEDNILEENELDVIITLNFAYGSLILSYRGYERTASFRSWSQKPIDQAAVFDLMLEFISDRLSKVVETSRKVSLEYVQLNRKTKKLYEKIVQSPSVPFSTLTELISGFKNLEIKAQEKKLLRAIQGAHDVLNDTEMKLILTIGFLDKHTEMIKSSNFTANDATLGIRNPFEIEIRQLFTKPIRIVVPHDKISQKLW